MQEPAFDALASLVITVILALITQLIRYRSQIGQAKDDPLQYALRNLVDKFTTADENLYVMTIIAKLIKALLQYVELLAGNGTDKVISELQRLTQMLESLITTVDPAIRKSSDNDILLRELKKYLAKGGRIEQ